MEHRLAKFQDWASTLRGCGECVCQYIDIRERVVRREEKTVFNKRSWGGRGRKRRRDRAADDTTAITTAIGLPSSAAAATTDSDLSIPAVVFNRWS